MFNKWLTLQLSVYDDFRLDRDRKHELEQDWSDKHEADIMDSFNVALRNEHTCKQFHAGAAVFQQVYVSLSLSLCLSLSHSLSLSLSPSLSLSLSRSVSLSLSISLYHPVCQLILSPFFLNSSGA